MNNAEILAAALTWIEAQIAENSYADVGILLSIHDGKIVKMQRTLTTKSKN